MDVQADLSLRRADMPSFTIRCTLAHTILTIMYLNYISHHIYTPQKIKDQVHMTSTELNFKPLHKEI